MWSWVKKGAVAAFDLLTGLVSRRDLKRIRDKLEALERAIEALEELRRKLDKR